jgi:nitroimidazol reductase NimA-like FMN-containing flavoprotein (pyridoxamine 5'-phosphate oxidase superfamily)
VTEKTKVRRIPKRGHYDFETIAQILDADFLCQVAFVHEGYPVVIPTIYGREDDYLYLHGATTSRMLVDLQKGIELSLNVTLVDGIVLARSGFHHSLNYRSVVVFGQATLVETPEEKERALEVISEQIIEGRWSEVRPVKAKELKATTVLKIRLQEASAKIRTGGPADEKEDYDLDIWAGVLPIKKVYGDPIPDENRKKELPLPKSVLRITKTN